MTLTAEQMVCGFGRVYSTEDIDFDKLVLSLMKEGGCHCDGAGVEELTLLNKTFSSLCARRLLPILFSS